MVTCAEWTSASTWRSVAMFVFAASSLLWASAKFESASSRRHIEGGGTRCRRTFDRWVSSAVRVDKRAWRSNGLIADLFWQNRDQVTRGASEGASRRSRPSFLFLSESIPLAPIIRVWL
jgi:hypothetical protein